MLFRSPVKTIQKGELSDTKTRPITPPTKSGRDWIDRGESNNITYTITLTQQNESFAEAKFHTGKYSTTWSVSSETDWESNESSTNWTDTPNGELRLGYPYDSFEDGDISEYAGQTGVYSTTTTRAKTGSYSLSGTPSNEGIVWDETVYGSSETVTVSAWIYLVNQDAKIGVFEQSTGAGYTVDVNVNNYLRLRAWSDFTTYDQELASKTMTIDAETWYKLRLTYDGSDGSMTGYVYDSSGNLIDSISATDTAYTPNTIGANNYTASAEEFFIDYLHLEADSGTWTSVLFDMGDNESRQVKSFDTSASVGSDEVASVRVGVDVDDDGVVDTWSVFKDVADGSNSFDYTDLHPYYDLDTQSFEKSMNAQDVSVQDLFWRDDGRKLYEIENYDNRIYEYNVSTPFDVDTTSISNSMGTESGEVNDLSWKPDGTKLYELGSFNSPGTIYEYDVGTSWDISTAILNTEETLTTEYPTGIVWNDDGSKLYESGYKVLDEEDAKIVEYDASTSYDITTLSKVNSIDIGYEVKGLLWNDDGSKLFTIDATNNIIREYNASTSYDITTLTLSKNIDTQDDAPTGLDWGFEGSKLYETGRASDKIYQYEPVSGELSEGYQYKVEYNLATTDNSTTHSPSIQDYELTTSVIDPAGLIPTNANILTLDETTLLNAVVSKISSTATILGVGETTILTPKTEIISADATILDVGEETISKGNVDKIKATANFLTAVGVIPVFVLEDTEVKTYYILTNTETKNYYILEDTKLKGG